MFTETSFDQNDGETKEALSVIDLDFDIGNLSDSPVPYGFSGVRCDESLATKATSDVSTADALLSAFDSISFVEHIDQRNSTAKDAIKIDAVGSFCQADLPGQRTDEGDDNISNFGSSEFNSTAEPSSQGDAEVVDEMDKNQKPSYPLIVYTSSRRKSSHSTNTNINQNNESQKPSRNSKRTAKKDSVDLNSLKISRKRRSLFTKPARSSGWGLLGNVLPAFEDNNGMNDKKLGNPKKIGRVKGGQGKRKAIRDRTGQTSVQKSSAPTRPISLKIKIGNQSCKIVNVTENPNTSEKITPGFSENIGIKFREGSSGDMVLTHGSNVGKVVSSDASVFGTLPDVRGNVENSSFGTINSLDQIVGHEEGDHIKSDPGTSPDSEVINSVIDTPLIEKGSPNMQGCPVMPTERRSKEFFTNSVPDDSFGDVSGFQVKPKKGKKKDRHYSLGNCFVKNKVTDAETASIAKTPARMTDSGSPMITTKLCQGTVMDPSSRLVAEIESSNSQDVSALVPCRSGTKFPNCSRAKGGSKNRPGIVDLRHMKDKTSKKKGGKSNLAGKNQIDEKGDAKCILGGVESHLITGNQTSSDLGENGSLEEGPSGPQNSLQFSSAGQRDQYVAPRNAWVLCDKCEKWRRIQATLADQIEETNCGWTCNDNTDKDFADCAIPQEKSNSEINEELEISDASGEEDACDGTLKSNRNRSKAPQKSWSLIKSNLFLHRSRKTQTIDEVMVCHCKPPVDGRMGCGAKCLNRMLNIECVRGTCPCGELCSNQQFQKRKYAKLKWFRCGKKGFGLQSLEDISEGQFLIEYVGEVLDIHAYEARQREYALQGHKHFYFMTLNGSEVIDACAKGNLGRYINHSCDPNCRTEKWMVNGEVCVGLFAVRDIKKGEEVTFDYNYVRVFGAAAKKCVCGSPNCRGYIGGDPTNSEAIVQGDSDDEHAEPVVICEDRELNDVWNDIMSNSTRERRNANASKLPENRYRTEKVVNTSGQFDSIVSETSMQKMSVNSASAEGHFKTKTATLVLETIVQERTSVRNDFASAPTVEGSGELSNTSESAALEVESKDLLSQMHSPSQLVDVSSQLEGMKKATPSAPDSAHELEMTTIVLTSKSQPDAIESKRKLKYGTLGGKEELAKSDSAKTRSSSSIKKGKLKSNVVNEKGTPDLDRSNLAPHKTKKLSETSLNSHVETVEEKLNELLDTEGGISKRKDASRGYLKLLFLTAASGTNGHGEAIQSNRDLSMILDALLKTRSRTVLVDIINKNGLQMLHNIMKRYRKEFNKTPILRKLLKVLEYLAVREILTLEHITGGPPCPGVESFKDSILKLTEHADKQVHQIARHFRDRWIPRSFRKSCFKEMDDRKVEFNQNGFGRLQVSSNDHRSGRSAEAAECRDTETAVASAPTKTSTLDQLPIASSNSGTNGTRIRKRKSRWDTPPEENPRSRIKTNISGDVKPNIDDEDVPPGFSSPCKNSVIPADASSIAFRCEGKDTLIKLPFDIVLGVSQRRFIASTPLSYGVPCSIMQQYGVLKAEIAEGWSVAAGLPFQPFPPLPPYAKMNGIPLASAAKCEQFSEPAEKAEQGNATCVAHQSGQKRPISCITEAPEMSNSIANEQSDFQREGGGINSNNLGRKFFRQQKWNNSKSVPPWVRIRNGWGQGGNTRNVMPGMSFGNGANQYRDPYISEDFNWGGEF